MIRQLSLHVYQRLNQVAPLRVNHLVSPLVDLVINHLEDPLVNQRNVPPRSPLPNRAESLLCSHRQLHQINLLVCLRFNLLLNRVVSQPAVRPVSRHCSPFVFLQDNPPLSRLDVLQISQVQRQASSLLVNQAIFLLRNPPGSLQ